MSAGRVYCIDRLNLPLLLLCVLPCLWRERAANKAAGARLWFVQATPLSAKFLQALAPRLSVTPSPWVFNIREVKDQQGSLLLLRVLCDDSNELYRLIAAQQGMKEAFERRAPDFPRLGPFLAKQTFSINRTEEHAHSKNLLLLQTFRWDLERRGMGAAEGQAFLYPGLWSQALSAYARPLGMHIRPLPAWNLPLKKIVTRLFGEHNPVYMYHFIRHEGWVAALRAVLSPRRRSLAPLSADQKPFKVLVEYYGQMNLGQPHLYSDLFFWPYSGIPGKDLVLSFNLAKDPLDKAKYELMQECGITELVVHPKASLVPWANSFYYWPRSGRRGLPPLGIGGIAAGWIGHQYAGYAQQFEYWRALFARHEVGLYVSWFKYGSRHCAIADALQSLGGITALYQRAVESLPSVGTMTCSDVFFGFSAAGAALEKGQGSRVPYYVITGYSGDHRFKILLPHAQKLRRRLSDNGARKVMAFFDENSYAGAWNLGHGFTQESYAFLLEKVLREPWFGLVLKPKVPSTLPKRLGGVAPLLERAQATGRCIVCAQGSIGSSFPPALAALAADVAVHGHMFAATAGLEAALCGVPTLLMDREGWPRSGLYRLGKGRSVFTDWDDLWRACARSWRPGVQEKIGDWSGLIEEFDPFRDGQAARRVGEYLTWLYQGLKEKLPRQEVLAQAAEKYAKKWGKDKVLSI